MRQVIHLSTHFLENVIDANNYPLVEIDELSKRIRRIGLGVMGMADLLVRLGIAYDSEEGVEMGRKIMKFVDDEAKVESERLAMQRGSFSEWEKSIWGLDGTCARNELGERIRPMQPAPELQRHHRGADRDHLHHRRLQLGHRAALRGGVHAEPGRRPDAGRERGLRRHRQEGRVVLRRADAADRGDRARSTIAEVPEKWQRVFVTANEIKPEWHIRMQAAFQEYNDSAISKTCNFAYDATEEYVEEIYRLAYKLNCKGVTVYRDGSRDMQVLSTGSTAKKVEEAVEGGRGGQVGQDGQR